jgi:hypothetical protein
VVIDGTQYADGRANREIWVRWCQRWQFAGHWSDVRQLAAALIAAADKVDADT